MHRIYVDEIRASSNTPTDVIGYLTSNLARFLLAPGTRQQEGLGPPNLPENSGDANVILVWNPRLALSPMIAPSFVLPLTWVESYNDCARLPKGVGTVADQVREALGIRDWGLALSPALDGVDLRNLEFNCGSIWAPLAAALLVAKSGGEPKPQVLSTGAWSGRGIEKISDIPLKVAAVEATFPANANIKPILFVPKLNESEALACASNRLTILAYPMGQVALTSLRKHLAELEAPPQTGALIGRRIEYVNREYLPYPKRQEYYNSHLIDSIADRVRESAPAPLRAVSRLVIGLGKQPELPLMLLKAIRPAEVLVLHTEDTSEHLPALDNQLKSWGGRLFSRPISLRDFKGAVQWTTDWLEEAGELEAVVDITAGNKIMTACVVLAAKSSGARRAYLSHDYDHGTQVFGSEQLHLVE